MHVSDRDVVNKASIHIGWSPSVFRLAVLRNETNMRGMCTLTSRYIGMGAFAKMVETLKLAVQLVIRK